MWSGQCRKSHSKIYLDWRKKKNIKENLQIFSLWTLSMPSGFLLQRLGSRIIKLSSICKKYQIFLALKTVQEGAAQLVSLYSVTSVHGLLACPLEVYLWVYSFLRLGRIFFSWGFEMIYHVSQSFFMWPACHKVGLGLRDRLRLTFVKFFCQVRFCDLKLNQFSSTYSSCTMSSAPQWFQGTCQSDFNWSFAMDALIVLM